MFHSSQRDYCAIHKRILEPFHLTTLQRKLIYPCVIGKESGGEAQGFASKHPHPFRRLILRTTAVLEDSWKVDCLNYKGPYKGKLRVPKWLQMNGTQAEWGWKGRSSCLETV